MLLSILLIDLDYQIRVLNFKEGLVIRGLHNLVDVTLVWTLNNSQSEEYNIDLSNLQDLQQKIHTLQDIVRVIFPWKLDRLTDKLCHKARSASLQIQIFSSSICNHNSVAKKR